MRTLGPQKGVIFLTLSQELFGYFPHIIVLSCIELIES